MSPEEAERKSRLLAADAGGARCPRHQRPAAALLGAGPHRGARQAHRLRRRTRPALRRRARLRDVVAPREDGVVTRHRRRRTAAEVGSRASLDQPPGRTGTTTRRRSSGASSATSRARCSGADIAIASDLPRAAGCQQLERARHRRCSWRSPIATRSPRVPSTGSDASASLEELAGYLGAIENGHAYGDLAGDRGVGTFGGSEDHTAILCAVPGTSSATLRAGAARGVGAARRLACSSSAPAASRPPRPASTASATTGGRGAAGAARALADADRRDAGDARRAARAKGRDASNGCARFIDDAPAGAGFPPRCCATGSITSSPKRSGSSRAPRGRSPPATSRPSATLVDESQHLAEQWLGNQIPETERARPARPRARAPTARRRSAPASAAASGRSCPEREADRFCLAWRAAYEAEFPMLASPRLVLPPRRPRRPPALNRRPGDSHGSR